MSDQIESTELDVIKTIAVESKDVLTITNAIQEASVNESRAVVIKSSFMPIFEQLRDIESQARVIVVTDAAQLDEMETAEKLRLKLVKIRTGSARLKDDLKEEGLREGRAIQAIHNAAEAISKVIERHCKEQATFAERAQARRIEERGEKRIKEISKYLPLLPALNTAGMMTAIKTMTDESFDWWLTMGEQLFELEERKKRDAEAAEVARAAQSAIDEATAAAKRGEDLKAKEQAEKDLAEAREVARLAKIESDAEIKRVKDVQEAAEREAKRLRDIAEAEALESARAAKAIADAEIKAAKDAQEAAEREAKRVKDQAEAGAREVARLAQLAIDEANRIKAEQDEADRVAKAAPDVEKLLAWSVAIEILQAPEVSSPEAQAIIDGVRGLLAKTATYIRTKTSAI